MKRAILLAAGLFLGLLSASAQYAPAVGGPGPAAPAPSPWGSPWNNPFNPSTPPPVNAATQQPFNPNWQQQGTIGVVGCGYDMQGVWRTIPMKVHYQYNGIQYNVTVLNVWNPWTDTWTIGVDDTAYNTTYTMRGMTFNYYVVTATGTYYFNL